MFDEWLPSLYHIGLSLVWLSRCHKASEGAEVLCGPDRTWDRAPPRLSSRQQASVPAALAYPLFCYLAWQLSF